LFLPFLNILNIFEHFSTECEKFLLCFSGQDEVISLAEKAAGRPLKCVIQTTELPGDEAVRVFLDFETQSWGFDMF